MAEQTLDEQLEFLDLEWYCDREGIDYRRTMGSRGEQLNLHECPACGGDKWKVYLNAETGLGNCFSGSCEKTFNKYTFIKEHIKAITHSAVRSHITLAVREQGWRPKKKSKEVEIVTGKVLLPISHPLPIDGKNLKYLAERGISSEIAEYFHLRYCESGMYLGLREGRESWQNFSNRVIIPIFDLDGTLATFQGRDLTGTADRKYLFPSGLPGTARYFLNGHNAVKAPHIVMNEGGFDVFATKIALDEDPELRDVIPVGSFGKKLTIGSSDGNDQGNRLLKLKAQGLKEITIMWDGEVKAYEEAINTALKIIKFGIKVRIALLPFEKDPNEVDGKVVRAAFRNAKQVTKLTAVRMKLNNPYKK